MIETTALQEQQSFQDRMQEKIRDGIGEWMTDEELAEVVKRGIDEVFFEGKITRNDYGRSTMEPPLIHQVVKEVLGPRMNAAVSTWLSEHDEAVNEAVSEAVRDGIAQALVSAVNSYFEQAMNQLRYDIENKLRDGMS